MNHNKLMEVLNELNLHRESSVTLRAEAKQAREALAQRMQLVEELEAQIQPLHARIAGCSRKIAITGSNERKTFSRNMTELILQNSNL